MAIVFCFCISFASCLNGNNETETSGVKETVDPAVLYDYKNIACKTSKGAKSTYFSFDDTASEVLVISLPVEWTLKASAEGYDILRDGKNIGELMPIKKDISSDETSCESETDSNSGVRSFWNIVYLKGRFTHRVVYTCEVEGIERVLTLEVDYAELDEYALKKIKYSMFLKKARTDAQMGTIDISARAGEKPILILGNSFVGTSQVGEIFKQMCNASSKNKYEVIGVSQGMASVSNNWDEYKDDMRYGRYAAVFMCGFYRTSDVDAFKTFADLCKQSGTPIVIFPAHNERTADSASNTYSDAYYLNWKGELDAFIASGVNRWDLCEDDYYDHSRPLAGYVGAHMIYRAVFNEMPPILEYYGSVSHSEVTKKLGNYARTGSIDLIEDGVTVYKFK
jgi:hypothetical protein